MEFTPTPVFYAIIGFLIGMLVGWVAGFFDSNGRASKKIEAAESNAKIKVTEAEQKLALASQSFQTQQDDPGLLRLKQNDGRLTFEMDGAPITGELSPDMRKRLIELIMVFRPLLEGGQVQQPVSQQPMPQQVAPQPAAPPPASRLPEPDFTQGAVISPVQPTLQSVFGNKKPVEAEKNILALSMVQQIDTVLQTRLLGTPLAKQGIRLQESIQGGVEVYVGLQKFLAVDDVPDETIKAAIRAAIAEWEKKYTPGL